MIEGARGVPLRLHEGRSDLFVNVHLGIEMNSFIVADLGNRTTITRDLPRDPPLESAHFTLQPAQSRISQRLLNKSSAGRSGVFVDRFEPREDTLPGRIEAAVNPEAGAVLLVGPE